MATLFVSDLHLSSERPQSLELFLRFCTRAGSCVGALYILGDLFELWLGDDDDTPPHGDVITALAALSAAGTDVHVGLGNRDFLLGKRFARATGARLLPDYHVIDLHGTRTLITHGDLLCTQDRKYQNFRRVVRNPLARYAFLGVPLSWRRRIAHKTQRGTKASMLTKDDRIMDVEQATVEAVMAAFDVTQLIHGHTHRPAVHDFAVNGVRRRRVVLGDWYEQDSLVFCDDRSTQPMCVDEFLRLTA